ncbi:hypothetical protein HYQ44_010830 [Verticillium longisporum]|nr:hypothetical protein HYQ44_010830 [Verticillium longisporum]
MPSESSWASGNQYTSRPIGRLPHQRESSLSSLGSAGPASPYNHSTSNPQIAITDSANDHYNDVQSHDGGAQYYQLSKAMSGTQEGGLYSGYHAFGGMDHSDMGYPVAIAMQRLIRLLWQVQRRAVIHQPHPRWVNLTTTEDDELFSRNRPS